MRFSVKSRGYDLELKIPITAINLPKMFLVKILYSSDQSPYVHLLNAHGIHTLLTLRISPSKTHSN